MFDIVLTSLLKRSLSVFLRKIQKEAATAAGTPSPHPDTSASEEGNNPKHRVAAEVLFDE
jgi:hypothetical protein